MAGLDALRQTWARCQHLHSPAGGLSLHDLLERTGWLRTLGGAEPYLALWARRPEPTVGEVHAAVQAGDLAVVPAARGCMYVVPQAQVGIALALAKAVSGKRLRGDLKKAGVAADALPLLAEVVRAALAEGPRSTRALGKVVQVKGLGVVLRLLELDGVVARRSVDGRLDHERYVWCVPPEAPVCRPRTSRRPLRRSSARGPGPQRWRTLPRGRASESGSRRPR